MLHQVDRLLAGLLPRSCILCGLDSGAKACCRGCRADLPWLAKPCRCCGVALLADYPLEYCPACRLPASRGFRVLSALDYVYPVDQMIAGAKFRQRLDYAAASGELLGGYLCSPDRILSSGMPDIIVPVPLHRRRLAARGFNQAAEIAAPVARCLGLPLIHDACVRIRHTLEQTSLTGQARRNNLAGAFVARPALTGLRVAVVDDVWTTGATARTLARAIMAVAASDVQIWTVARVG